MTEIEIKCRTDPKGPVLRPTKGDVSRTRHRGREPRTSDSTPRLYSPGGMTSVPSTLSPVHPFPLRK